MKERLTDAALDLMWENSYGTTSVDAICERAGAKKGSFYYFFKSKSELTVAALEAEWNKNKANMDALFSPTVPPLERFDRYFDHVHDRLAELQEEVRFDPRLPSSEHRERSQHTRPKRARYDRPHLDRKIKYFESAIRDAHAQGLIVAPDPEAKARALFACYHGTLAQARIQNDVELLRDFKQVAMDVLGVKHEHAASS